MLRYCALLLSLVFSASLWAIPRVVVTLKPLHSLTAAIMEGVAQPACLLPDGASPHTFQLKPSTLKQLQLADMIIWVGPDLETFLINPSQNFKPTAGWLTLLDTPHLETWPIRKGDRWEQDHHHHAHTLDPHIWLSPINAQKMATHITDNLCTLDPAHAPQYRKNAQVLHNRLDKLQSRLHTMLQPLGGAAFLVYHDAYQYFEKTFNLQCLGTITANPHLPLSIKRLKKIKSLILEQQIRCVFREPEFPDRLLKGLNIPIAELDPLGTRIPAGPSHYEQTLLTLGQALKAGLLAQGR